MRRHFEKKKREKEKNETCRIQKREKRKCLQMKCLVWWFHIETKLAPSLSVQVVACIEIFNLATMLMFVFLNNVRSILSP